MPDCDSSKLMPLITVTGETQQELEQQLRPSLILGLASCGWHIVHSHHISSPWLWLWLLFTLTLQPFEEKALMKEKHLNTFLLLVSCGKKDSWSSRAKRDEVERG